MWECLLSSLEGGHLTYPPHFHGASEKDVGFGETLDSLAIGASEATRDVGIGIERDLQGARDFDATRVSLVEGMAEGVAAVEWIEDERGAGGRAHGLAGTDGTLHGQGQSVCLLEIRGT